MSKGENVEEDIKSFLISSLCKDEIIGFYPDIELCTNFFDSPSKSNSDEDLTIPRNPVLDISIIADTVHGVKGETHTATLFLETFKDRYDVSKILKYFNPSKPKKKLQKTEKEILKLAYVATSRPTHLLCVAVHKSTQNRGKEMICHDLSKLKTELGSFWDIIDLSENLTT